MQQTCNAAQSQLQIIHSRRSAWYSRCTACLSDYYLVFMPSNACYAQRWQVHLQLVLSSCASGPEDFKRSR